MKVLMILLSLSGGCATMPMANSDMRTAPRSVNVVTETRGVLATFIEPLEMVATATKNTTLTSYVKVLRNAGVAEFIDDGTICRAHRVTPSVVGSTAILVAYIPEASFTERCKKMMPDEWTVAAYNEQDLIVLLRQDTVKVPLLRALALVQIMHVEMAVHRMRTETDSSNFNAATILMESYNFTFYVLRSLKIPGYEDYLFNEKMRVCAIAENGEKFVFDDTNPLIREVFPEATTNHAQKVIAKLVFTAALFSMIDEIVPREKRTEVKTKLYEALSLP